MTTTIHHSEQDKLYDRQIYVIGHEAMKRMAQSNVLLVGLGGLGVEVGTCHYFITPHEAKNIILAGVKSVTLHDSKNATFTDMSSQFLLNESNIGANRADACVAALRELNPYVHVHVHHGDLVEAFLKTFNVVVFTDTPISQLVAINQLARSNNVKFVAAESRGVFGAVFCDFGAQFEVADVDGETPVSNIVTGITNDTVPTIHVFDDKPKHGLYDGEFVVFEEVQGMTEINETKPIEIVSTGRHAFTLKNFDTSKFGKYSVGGIVKQCKMPKVIDFVSLKESLAETSPSFIETDFSKYGRPADLHAIFKAYSEFVIRNNRDPKPYNTQDAEDFVSIAKEFKGDINEHVARLFAFTCTGNLNANAAFLGGIVAQEVQKAVSGKFHPLHQWLYFDAVEVLPEILPTQEDTVPLNCRYDGQIVVFGNKFQQELLNKKLFIVGAGALGCEYLKNYALAGVGCGPKGKIIVTDMDNIEISNLSRQFLFSKKHVGKMKSKVAAEATQAMNPSVNITSMSDKVASQTEDIFDAEFWENLDCVTNALDNIQARLYVDSRCIYYKLPLLEAGTLGTKANMQVVVPHLSESYGSSVDPPEQSIAICTLKSFPNAIEHTIQWARDLFEGLFKQAADDANAYLTKTEEFLQELESQHVDVKISTLEGVLENLVTCRPSSFQDCVAWARFKFEHLYKNQIQKLLHNLPLDTLTTSGTPFWTAEKRPPSSLTFDEHDSTHIGFVMAAATLRAYMYNVEPSNNVEEMLSNITMPSFSPSNFGIDEKANENIISQLPKPENLTGYYLRAMQFEKDDDSNHHVEFVTHASNLRARNYKIKEASVHHTKGIAGKIIPAMITTTAAITGLAMFEFYKLMQKRPKLGTYKNAFLNIAIPFVTLSEPTKPAQKRMLDLTWNLWDRIDINFGRDVTMKEFVDYFKSKYNLEITMIACGTVVLFSFFSDKKKIQQRMAMPMAQAVQSISNIEFAAKDKYINLEVCCSDENVDIPAVKYQFQHFV